jgi:fermentation-respiration switch protein FrsA (DUF1100 family)
MIKLILLLVLLGCAAWALSTLERRSLYFPDHEMAATPQALGLAYDDLTLKSQDGSAINAWFVPAKPGGPGRTILVSHGNAGNISHRLDKIATFHELGLAVLIFDYRGYGKSPGRPSENGTYQDGDAAYAYLTQTRRLPPSDVVLYGESLGCAVAVELARRHPASALILESPFTSTLAMGKLVYPWLPVRWIVRYRYDNLAKIGSLRLPLLILHSSQDEIVPFSMGQQLYAAAPGPKAFFELRGGHNDGYEVTGLGYRDAIRKFLDTNGGPS